MQGAFWDTLLPHDLTENPFAAWADRGQQEHPGGSRSTETWNDVSWESRSTEPWTAGGPQWAFPVESAYHEDDDGTDTDTSSDDGGEDIARPDVSNMGDAEASMIIYMAYSNAKIN